MEQIAAGIEGAKLLLNPREAKVAEKVIDYFNIQAITREFWKRDCADVLLECYWLANNCLDQDTDEFTIQWAEYAAGLMLKTIEPPPEERHETLFHIFQAMVLNYAFMAHETKGFRKFAGIRRSFFRV